ncbi:MAG: hypothetical protein ACTSR8_00975 [Promethearchaeota archaeon]
MVSIQKIGGIGALFLFMVGCLFLYSFTPTPGMLFSLVAELLLISYAIIYVTDK